MNYPKPFTQSAWFNYVNTLEWDSWRGMFVKQAAFWSYYHPGVFTNFYHDETLFRGVRY